VVNLAKKIYYNSRDIEFFLRDYFLFARPVYRHDIGLNTIIFIASGNDDRKISARTTSWLLLQVILRAVVPKLFLIAQYLSDCQFFGEDIRRVLPVEDFSVRRFWPWTLTATSQKLIVKFGTDAEHLNEQTNEPTNQPTNKQTRQITMHQVII